MKLVENIAKKIDALCDQFIQYIMKDDFKAGEPLLIEAWALLPEPKDIYDESFHIATYAVDNYIMLNKFEYAKKWAEILQKCSLERHDSGERELQTAKVAFEMADFELAKKLFLVANKKSGGRVFKRGDDKKYHTFFKENR